MEEDSTTDMDVSYEETTHHNGSSDTHKKLTGKRVRKKNPKYLDEDDEPKKKTSKRGRKKGTGNRKNNAKKPKLTHDETPSEMQKLHDQKRQLELNLMKLNQQLQKINQQLNEKDSPVNGLTDEDKLASVSNQITATMEQLSELANRDASTSTDDLGFDEPTDDEDEAYTKPPVDTPPPPPPPIVKPKKASPVKKTPPPKRKPAAKAKAPKQTESIATSRPQRVRRSTVKDLDQESEPSLSPTMEACRKVLKALMGHRYAFPFNVPVDPVALKIPDYFQIITNPMDFGTILQRINTEQYDDMDEFCTDMELVFNNACTYNRPTSDVYIMAETLRNLYKKKIQAVEEKEKEVKGEVVNETSISQGAICELKKTVDVMRQELSLLREQQGVAPPKTTRKPAARAKQRPEEPLPMTKEEKKKLSMGINSLSGANLAMVVKIIKEKMPNIANAQEIVIDIETLDSATLRSLESYVNKVKRKKSKRRPSKRKPGQPGTPLNPEEIASKIELAKQTELGTQSRILDVQRQLQEIQSKSAALTRSGTFPTPATPTPNSATPISPSPTTPTPGAPSSEPKKAETSESSESGESGSDSESSSSESESSSSDSESGDENGKTTKTSTSSQPFQVETVIAPVFSNIGFNKSTPPVTRRAEETPHIIPAVAPTEVKVDNIKNADSWSLLAEEDSKKTEATVESADVKNLWSTFVDNHALLKQKELEKQQREEELRRKRVEQEERKRQELIQKQKEEEEAKLRKEREIEEAKIMEERKIEEARLQAKRQLESKQLQEVEPISDDIFSMSNYSSSISGVKMPDHMLNLLKKSGTNLSNNSQ